MPEPAAVFSRRIAGSFSEIHPLADAISEWASVQAVPPRVINSVILMLDELITNVVMHGFRDSGEGSIEVTLAIEDGCVAATVRDSAPAFDPFSIPEADTSLDAEDRGIGGLGVHFVRKMSDGYGYRRDGDINEVSLRKRLS
ncbi:ATP-binding protein [Caenimonas terrae]|uniref:ATP-binding protein n=1 Tax=Caenimonas terrae TaxID=696074 RepID=A0ABW0NGE4_9BURK